MEDLKFLVLADGDAEEVVGIGQERLMHLDGALRQVIALHEVWVKRIEYKDVLEAGSKAEVGPVEAVSVVESIDIIAHHGLGVALLSPLDVDDLHREVVAYPTEDVEHILTFLVTLLHRHHRHVVDFKEARLEILLHTSGEVLILRVKHVDVAVIVLRGGDVEAVKSLSGGCRGPDVFVLDPWEVGLRATVVDVVLDAVREDCLVTVFGNGHLQVRLLLGRLCVCDRERFQLRAL